MGKTYPALSRAYFMAVHEVLAGKKSAATALADLQTELVQITGLHTPTLGTSSGAHGKLATFSAMPPCAASQRVL
jgi:glycine cleavage system protein P-like pyridoxal-binding family